MCFGLEGCLRTFIVLEMDGIILAAKAKWERLCFLWGYQTVYAFFDLLTARQRVLCYVWNQFLVDASHD